MLIIHRCATATCRQPDYWHDDGGRRTTAGEQVDGETVTEARRRRCPRHRKGWGPSETAPRWTTPGCEPITEVLPPGNKAGGGSTTCDCDECWELWKQLTGQTRKPRHPAAVPSGA